MTSQVPTRKIARTAPCLLAMTAASLVALRVLPHALSWRDVALVSLVLGVLSLTPLSLVRTLGHAPTPRRERR